MSVGIVPLMAAATGVQAAGQAIQTIGNMKASSYQAAVAARNAKLADDNARRASEQGQIAGQDAGEVAGQTISEIMAAQGASGLQVGVGSGAQYLLAARRLAARDQLRIRQESQERVGGYLQQGADFRAEERQTRRAGRFSLVSGVLGIGSSVVGGAQQIQGYRMGLA